MPENTEWLLHEENRFVFWFRPRCGSTTLTRWFFENLGVKFTGFSISGYRVEWFDERRDRLTKFLDEEYDNLHKFVVVRNPYDRAVSSYLHVVNNPADSQWVVVKPKLDHPMEKHDLTFREFARFLFKEDMDHAHTIWRRQSALSCWKRGVNDIVTLKEMNQYLQKMNQRFGLQMPRLDNSVTVADFDESNETRSSWADVPFKELLRFKEKTRFRKFPRYEDFYDKELRDGVSGLYEEDIKIFRKGLQEELSRKTFIGRLATNLFGQDPQNWRPAPIPATR